MRVVLRTEEFIAVGFDIPVAEFLTSRDVQRHPELAALGPDLLAAEFDREEAARRLAALSDASLADALLNQRALAGVGNVFKSEILFVAGLDPFRTVGSLDGEQLQRLVEVARELLRVNVLETGPAASRYRRTTRRANPAAGLWVYARGGRPCRRCGTPVEYRKHGRDARGTYWCPKCQG
jgi:endonuclease-8